MAFERLKNILNNSLFTQQTYTDALKNNYAIQIIPDYNSVTKQTPVAIKGILKNNLQFNMNADYGTINLGSVVSNFPKIEELSRILPLAPGGISIANAGMTTRKYYLRSGYLELNPEMRIVDWDGTGEPVKSALLLVALCLPKKNDKTNISISDIINMLKKGLSNVADKIPGGKELYEGLVQGLEDSVAAVGDEIGKRSPEVKGGIARGLKEVTTSDFMLTSSPGSVKLIVGNFFERDNMIVENVGVNFSKELTEKGPLWVDLSIKMSSKEALTLDVDEQFPLGFKSPPNRFFQSGGFLKAE